MKLFNPPYQIYLGIVRLILHRFGNTAHFGKAVDVTVHKPLSLMCFLAILKMRS